MLEFLNQVIFNNTVLNYLMFIGSFILSILVLVVIEKFVLKRLLEWAGKTIAVYDDTFIRGLGKCLLPFLYVGALYLSSRILHLNATIDKIIEVVTMAFLCVFVAVFVSSLLVFLLSRYWEKKYKNADKLTLRWMAIVIRVAVWAAALLLFLENIGIEITTLIAGLGISGIAVAFAAQAVLADVFSFVTIFFDRPFEIDDFIVVDDLMGTVEHIGVKTTRVRSLNGEQLVFSNKDLTSSRLRNYKRMQKRRVLFKLGVTYDTPLAKLKEIPDLIKSIIADTKDTAIDRAHFSEYTDFSLNFEVVYYVLNQDYNLYMDIQQEINFRIKEEFEKREIEFAMAARTLYAAGQTRENAADRVKIE